MNRQYLIAGGLAVVVVVLGLGAAFFLGVGPAPGGNSGETLTDFPTATPGDDSSDGSGSDSTSDFDPFTFTVDKIEECGQTCRDVTATLHNHQNDTATGVTVFTRIYAGENNTVSDDLVWEGKEEIGTLDADGSHTTTERVELSLQDAQKINQNDGWITILTTVKTDQQTVTFQDSEQVA